MSQGATGDRDLWKITNLGRGNMGRAVESASLWHYNMISMPRTQAKKWNWAFLRLQPLSKLVPSVSSASHCPGDQSKAESNWFPSAPPVPLKRALCTPASSPALPFSSKDQDDLYLSVGGQTLVIPLVLLL